MMQHLVCYLTYRSGARESISIDRHDQTASNYILHTSRGETLSLRKDELLEFRVLRSGCIISDDDSLYPERCVCGQCKR